MKMALSRRRQGLVVLALMLLGIALGAAAALASGDCCAGMRMDHASSEPPRPCHSVAPSSCCEPTASGTLPASPGAPALAGCPAGLAQGALPLASLACVSEPPRLLRPGVSTTVLRL